MDGGKLMIKKVYEHSQFVKVTLLVEVDTEDDEQCAVKDGNPLEENCVLNMINNDGFLCPVHVLDVCYAEEN
jgi:hypothetical protein